MYRIVKSYDIDIKYVQAQLSLPSVDVVKINKMFSITNFFLKIL